MEYIPSARRTEGLETENHTKVLTNGMANPPWLLNQPQSYQPIYAVSKMDMSFKLDEGYSEETRSQDSFDSPMRLGSLSDEALTMSENAAPALPPAILALSEAERSGKLDQCPVSRTV